MLTGLLASARELRNPLTVGYAAATTLWLLAGDGIAEAARQDELGRRIIGLLDSMGDAGEFAAYTFVAAMLGSLLWNAAIARLVDWLAVAADHPDWQSLIEDASDEVRRYEEHTVLTYKGQGQKPSAFDAKHTVPSPQHGAYLRARVEERERKAAEMSFRMTLAISLVPVVLALGIEGGGRWWWATAVVPVVWADVALLKYTTLNTVRRFELEDLQSQLDSAKEQLKETNQNASSARGDDLARLERYAEKMEQQIAELEVAVAKRERYQKSNLTRFVSWIVGPGRS